MAWTNLSTWLGGKSAKLRDKSPDFNSSESIRPSPFVSNRPNKVFTSIELVAIQVRKISMTSSATKTTPHSGHFVESRGTSELHAPHSPKASSETPENEIPHSGQFSESIGTTARQEPHSAIAISSFSSVIPSSPV